MDSKELPKMKSNYKLINNKIEDEFYWDKTHFEDTLETEARKVFKELTQLTFFKHIDQLKLGNKSLVEDSGYDFELKEKDFVELFTGQYIKDFLFISKTYVKKKDYINEYGKFFEIMGGDTEGLSKDALTDCLRESLKLAGIKDSTLNYDKLKQEIDEIFSIFPNNKYGKIPVEDFIKIMTSD